MGDACTSPNNLCRWLGLPDREGDKHANSTNQEAGQNLKEDECVRTSHPYFPTSTSEFDWHIMMSLSSSSGAAAGDETWAEEYGEQSPATTTSTKSSGRTLANTTPRAITQNANSSSSTITVGKPSAYTAPVPGRSWTCKLTDADMHGDETGSTHQRDTLTFEHKTLSYIDGLQKPAVEEESNKVEAQIVGQRVEQILFKAKQQLQEMDQYLSSTNEGSGSSSSIQDSINIQNSSSDPSPALGNNNNNKRISISASLKDHNNRESFVEYSPILEKATQVDVSSGSKGYPNLHESASSTDSYHNRGSDDTVPSVSRQVSINMVRETTQRMESLLGELKDLRRSTSEQRSRQRDSAYTERSASGSIKYYQKNGTTKPAEKNSPPLSQRDSSPILDHLPPHPNLQAPPTPPITTDEESSKPLQQVASLWRTPPQPNRNSHSRSHSLPLTTHLATQPLTLSPLKRQPQKSRVMDNNATNTTATTNGHYHSPPHKPQSPLAASPHFTSAPSSPAFSKIGQPPTAKPPPPPPPKDDTNKNNNGASPPKIPPTWPQPEMSLKEEMDYLLDVPPSVPSFLSNRISHDSSTDSYTTAQSDNDSRASPVQFQRTETGNVSHSSGNTVRGLNPTSELSDSSPILAPMHDGSSEKNRKLASPVKEPTKKQQPTSFTASTTGDHHHYHHQQQHKKDKHKKKKSSSKHRREKSVPSSRPFSQPNIQNLMDLSNNSFRLDQIDLPPDEKHLLEKFIDALSKLSVEINLDERKKVEGKRRLQNALRAIEGWI